MIPARTSKWSRLAYGCGRRRSGDSGSFSARRARLAATPAPRRHARGRSAVHHIAVRCAHHRCGGQRGTRDGEPRIGRETRADASLVGRRPARPGRLHLRCPQKDGSMAGDVSSGMLNKLIQRRAQVRSDPAETDGPAGWFPRSPDHRSVREAPSCTPAASPRLSRRPSPWLPHRWN